jgi:hypothetical protein
MRRERKRCPGGLGAFGGRSKQGTYYLLVSGKSQTAPPAPAPSLPPTSARPCGARLLPFGRFAARSASEGKKMRREKKEYQVWKLYFVGEMLRMKDE